MLDLKNLQNNFDEVAKKLQNKNFKLFRINSVKN